MKILLIFLLVPLLAAAADKPTAKAAKRIAQIESDFGAHFVQIVQASSENVSSDYWTFIKLSPGSTFTAFPFTVPVNATDKQVLYAIVSSLQTAQFYDLMIKKALPSPSPTGLQGA